MSDMCRLVVETFDPNPRVVMILTDYGPGFGFKIEVASQGSALATLDLDHWNKLANAHPGFAEVFEFFQEAAARRTAQALGDGGQSG